MDSPAANPLPPEGNEAASRWARLRTVFEASLARPLAERPAYLAAAREQAGLDEAQYAELLAMLSADESADTTPGDLAALAPALLNDLDMAMLAQERAALIGSRYGGWTLRQCIGSGGMGTVWLAERPVGDTPQRGALKLIRTGWDSLELRRRFRSERRILAALRHPGIAALLDGGEASDGQPWLVMEYVEGVPIHLYCDERQLGLAGRLALFLAVCEAIAHAHRSLVVHRDLKPANILVDTDGRVKLLDFGIAKLVEPGQDLTGTGHRLFTPEFAAPEQIRGDPVTTSVDIHALGLLLYTLLTGRRPWSNTATPFACEQAVLREQPTRPSQMLLDRDHRAITPVGQLPATRLAAQLRGDLDAIVMKALRKEPAERYATADELAADVRRHLRREPVHAHRGGLRYRTRRFLQRNAWTSAAVALALLSLLGGFGVALWQAREAQLARLDAEREANIAGAVAEFMTRAFSLADPDLAGVPNPSARQVLELGRESLQTQAGLDAATHAALLLAIARAHIGLGELEQAGPLLEQVRPLLAEATLQTRVAWHLAMAIVLNNQGDPGAALAILQPADRELTTASADALPALRAQLDGLFGLLLHNLGRHEEALPHLVRAREAMLAREGSASAELTKILGVHVGVLDALDRDAEASAIADEAYRAAKAAPGVRPAVIANFANAYGMSLLQQGRYVEAEQMFAEALAINEQLHGPDSEQLRSDLNNLAISIHNQARYDDASALFQRLLSILRKRYSVDDVRIARVELTIGLGQLQGQKPAEALPWLRDGLARWDRSGSPRTGRYMAGQLGLVRVQEALGDWAAAQSTLDAVEPFLTGELRVQGREYQPLTWLLTARLADRREDWTAACSASAQLLALANSLEGQVLRAHCLTRLGEDAAAVLDAINPQDSRFAEIHPHSRGRWDVLRAAATTAPR